MKKLFIAIAVLVMMVFGIGSAQAAQWEPNGEEQVVTLTVPTALHGCARTAADIQNLQDVYVDYNGAQELVASWTVTEGAEAFTATATLQSQFYSLNNPLHPGRSTEVVIPIEKCPAVEVPPVTDVPNLPPNPETPVESPTPDDLFKPVLTGSDPVVVPPVVQEPVVPVQQIEIPAVPSEKPVEAPVAALTPSVVPNTMETPQAVTAAPVVATEELAATGVNEGIVWLGVGLLGFGIAFLLLSMKWSKK